MTAWGLHCAHERQSPIELLRQAEAAQRAGFDTVSCSEPGAVAALGATGPAWSWLGAVMERTHLPIGALVALGRCRHPAQIALAMAPLAQMHPSRLWVALCDEDESGPAAPLDEAQSRRLGDGAEIIRRLMGGEEVVVEAEGEPARAARLPHPPQTPVPVLAFARSPESAERCASWADGLVTVRGAADLMERTLRSYRRRGGRGPVILHAPHGWAPDEDEARLLTWRQWPVSGFGDGRLSETSSPEEVAAAYRLVGLDELAARVAVSSDLAAHRAWMEEYVEIGFDAVSLSPLGAPPLEFIEELGREVLPRLR